MAKAIIQQQVDELISEMTQAKKDIQSILDKLMPVGFIYTQFSGQSAPSDLFGGTWSNVSSTYAGLFFRAEGGNAAAFGSTQTDGAPDVHGQGVTVSGFLSSENRDAFTASSQSSATGGYSTSTRSTVDIKFRASSYNAIFGRANEIRPANSTIRIWKRTA